MLSTFKEIEYLTDEELQAEYYDLENIIRLAGGGNNFDYIMLFKLECELKKRRIDFYTW